MHTSTLGDHMVEKLGAETPWWAIHHGDHSGDIWLCTEGGTVEDLFEEEDYSRPDGSVRKSVTFRVPMTVLVEIVGGFIRDEAIARAEDMTGVEIVEAFIQGRT